MTKENNNMDNFLRGSLDNLEVQPAQSVWKGISKRLIILELLRLNFTNIGKSWLYSGAAFIAAVGGMAYYSLTPDTDLINEDIVVNQEQAITSTISSKESKTLQIHTEIETSNETENTDSKDAKHNTPENIVTIVSDDMDSKAIEKLNEPEQKTQAVIEHESSPKTKNKHQQINKVETDLFANTKTSSNSQTISSDEVTDRTQSERMPSIYKAKSSSIYIYDPSSSWSARALLLSKHAKTKDFGKPLTKKQRKKQKTQPSSSRNMGQQTTPLLINEEPKLSWYISPTYMPEWAFTSDNMYVNSSQFSVQGGLIWKKLQASIGIGFKTEKTPSLFNTHFQTFDSVGFYYDIEYYEIDPINMDTIIVHFNIQNIYDSVKHESQSKGPDQRRRWVFIPIEIGYQLFATPKYELYGKLSAKLGWEYYTEQIELANPSVMGYYQENITPESQSPYFQIGIGLENNFNIMPQWWIYAEPRVNYYMKNPYILEGTKKNGPFSFGIQLGIKYKFKGRQ